MVKLELALTIRTRNGMKRVLFDKLVNTSPIRLVAFIRLIESRFYGPTASVQGRNILAKIHVNKRLPSPGTQASARGWKANTPTAK